MKTQFQGGRGKTLVLLGITGVLMACLGYVWFEDGMDAGRKRASASLGEKVRGEGVLESAGRSVVEAGERRGSGASGGAGAPVVLLPVKGGPSGAPLRGLAQNPSTEKGRVWNLDRGMLGSWARVQEGQTVALPSADGEGMEGVVHLRMEEGGWLRFGGILPGREGTFSLSTNVDQVYGSILLPEAGVGFQIRTEPSGQVVLVERPLSALVCWPGLSADSRVAAAAAAEAAADPTAGKTIAQGGQVPSLNTRPGAKGVIYIDFDGEAVADPDWNGGRLINAAPANVTADQIREVVARVAEDFAPFDVAISTNRSDYDSASPGRRMRVIVTPTDTAARASGGVSMVGSWSQSGRGMSSTIPAWVFNTSVKAIAEGVSHEAGHTFGLNHDGIGDGLGPNAYYAGHGGGVEVPTSWAPIMGNSYSRSLTQWSKGEYADANNTEDDLAIISSVENGIGYRTDGSSSGALSFSGNAFQVTGLLRSASVADVYPFKTSGGSLRATAVPVSGKYTNVDVSLELRDASGKVLASASPVDALGASLSKDGLAEGNYQLVVRAAGTGPRPAGGYTSGYSDYDSLGAYTLSGTVGNPVLVPTFLSGASVSGVVGKPLSFTVQVSAGANLGVSPEAIPSWLSYDATKRAFTGTPSAAGKWTLNLTASNTVGSVSQALVLQVDEPTLPLESILGGVTGLVTGPASAPWSGTTVLRADGQAGVVALSGKLGDGGVSRLQFRVPGQSVLSFWWKVSSEKGHDFMVCRINGGIAKDADSGALLALSGESGWVKQRIALPGWGDQLVDIAYAKDATLSDGQDRAYVYGVEVSRPPVFRGLSAFPRALDLWPGDKGFVLTLQVDGAMSYQWKKDGGALTDGSVGTHTISGATTASLTVSGVSADDSGVYVLEAKNASGTVTSPGALVTVGGVPQITKQPIAPVGLKVGSPLLLTVEASGTKPIQYYWVKDGMIVQRGSSASYQVPVTKGSSAGQYMVWAFNRFGAARSETVQVSVEAALPAATSSAKITSAKAVTALK